jgi:hypothetical protein
MASLLPEDREFESLKTGISRSQIGNCLFNHLGIGEPKFGNVVWNRPNPLRLLLKSMLIISMLLIASTPALDRRTFGRFPLPLCAQAKNRRFAPTVSNLHCICVEPPFFGLRAGGARPCHVRQDRP